MHSVELTDAAVMKTIHFPQGMPFQFTLLVELTVTDILLFGWEHFQMSDSLGTVDPLRKVYCETGTLAVFFSTSLW